MNHSQDLETNENGLFQIGLLKALPWSWGESKIWNLQDKLRKGSQNRQSHCFKMTPLKGSAGLCCTAAKAVLMLTQLLPVSAVPQPWRDLCSFQDCTDWKGSWPLDTPVQLLAPCVTPFWNTKNRSASSSGSLGIQVGDKSSNFRKPHECYLPQWSAPSTNRIFMVLIWSQLQLASKFQSHPFWIKQMVTTKMAVTSFTPHIPWVRPTRVEVSNLRMVTTDASK